MLSRSSIYTLAAVALMGAAALAPTGASAHLPMGVMVNPKVQGLVIKPQVQGLVIKPQVMGVVLHPVHPVLGVIIHPQPPIGFNNPPHFWWHHHHEPVLIEGGETIRETIHETAHVSAPVASAPTAPCNCLTKSYLQDGSLLFKDICTKESALATPDDLRAQAQGTAPQAH
jgi:hypothetical protein